MQRIAYYFPLLLFILFTFALFEQGRGKQERLRKDLNKYISTLYKEKEEMLIKKAHLEEELLSQNDPIFREQMLIQTLGVIPEACKKKVIFVR